MHQAVLKLKNILKLERDIYLGILNIEENKSEAIMKKGGRAIEELSLSQEKLLSKIDSLEKERVKVMAEIRSAAGFRFHGEDMTLQDIAGFIGGEPALSLKKTGAELKTVLMKVKKVQDLNSQLLKDNMEYYDILISGLRNSSTLRSGYGSDGKEKGRVVNPVLFNIKA